jgi:hypothetical protein
MIDKGSGWMQIKVRKYGSNKKLRKFNSSHNMKKLRKKNRA